MSLYQTLGKAITGTASVAGVITAAPVFGPKGTITSSGIVVSVLVGTSAAFIDQAVQSTRLQCPTVTANEYCDEI
ncbi:hypothetical protein [Vibrio parahaemolyticus]|uniref:Uncharacterized protein n=4 Tax=Vibrio parahaemolyticus TaxID=670 RepID=A0A8H9JZG8_VIBPH|nr:hypothetical protein [Vibrio parahaemolyticus]AGR00322.1 hypothetical protein M636_20500 [Vibrio parahaemolyticus O1:K33 str. CDC_K4557]EGQ8197815.1 hypothetical protein [Vibrio parahaemolyticus]EGR3114146.1 hypothetical protein [Vibrio parahaemolyticus]EHA6958000.1 hypothetical protein [Vibrio parahaemolyticus]EHA6972374.1 hypothetical protein [Vibrio parahaemolyticus]